MTKGQDHYRQQIIDDAWFTVFSATNTAMMEYPYVLGKPGECSPTLASMADTYIMDSKIGDESVGTAAVLEAAEHVGADVVTPADVLHNPQTTTERIIELFIALTEYDTYTPDVMIPLQPNPQRGLTHVDHYYDVADRLHSVGLDITDYRLSVGGIKDWTPPKQLDTICSVRSAAGTDQYIHGLGFDATADWIAVFRQYPCLLDSIDMSSIVQDVVNGQQLLTPTMERVSYPLPRGRNSTVLSVMLREFVLYMMMYFLGPHPRESDVPTTIESTEMKEVLAQYEQTTSSPIAVNAD